MFDVCPKKRHRVLFLYWRNFHLKENRDGLLGWPMVLKTMTATVKETIVHQRRHWPVFNSGTYMHNMRTLTKTKSTIIPHTHSRLHPRSTKLSKWREREVKSTCVNRKEKQKKQVKINELRFFMIRHEVLNMIYNCNVNIIVCSLYSNDGDPIFSR